MNVEGENLPTELLDVFSKKHTELKNDLVRTDRHLLKEMDFICHVEHPHNLRTTLCVRFKSEVVWCGVVYAVACKLQAPLPENPPWWLASDADKSWIDEVCRVISHLYNLSKAQYIPMYNENDSFTSRNKIQDRQTQHQKEVLRDGGTKDASLSKEAIAKASPLDELKETMKLGDDSRRAPAEGDSERTKTRDHDSRGRDSGYDGRVQDSDIDREREKDLEFERGNERRHSGKDKGSIRILEASFIASEYHSSHASCGRDRHEKDRHRHHPYG